MGRGFFVIGTDTGVGKTTIAVGLAPDVFTGRGVRMAAMKEALARPALGDDAQR